LRSSFTPKPFTYLESSIIDGDLSPANDFNGDDSDNKAELLYMFSSGAGVLYWV
jgi:hypothetical protein